MHTILRRHLLRLTKDTKSNINRLVPILHNRLTNTNHLNRRRHSTLRHINITTYSHIRVTNHLNRLHMIQRTIHHRLNNNITSIISAMSNLIDVLLHKYYRLLSLINPGTNRVGYLYRLLHQVQYIRSLPKRTKRRTCSLHNSTKHSSKSSTRLHTRALQRTPTNNIPNFLTSQFK